MRPLFTVVVWVVAGVHFAFLLYLVGGGFLALRWRRTIAAHTVAVGWAVASVGVGLWCPLTALERWARAGAGMAPLSPAGFIDHYLTGVIYPAAGTGYAQAAAFGAVAVSWVAYLSTRRRPPRPGGGEDGDVGGVVPHRRGARKPRVGDPGVVPR